MTAAEAFQLIADSAPYKAAGNIETAASRKTRPLLDRFLEKVAVQENECWLWTAWTMKEGYGQIGVRLKTGYRMVLSHRLAYEMFVGPIPEGLQLDHLCRNRACVNPAHLEPVTQRENLLRGDTIVGRQARQTHCIRGHEFTPENTYRSPGSPGHRNCLACMKLRESRRPPRKRKVTA